MINEKLPNKLIISADWIETLNYEKAPFRDLNFLRKNWNKRTYRENEKVDNKNSLLRSETSLRRSKITVARLINSNPDLNKFITLTFRDNVVDLNFANYAFNKFIQRLRYFYGKDFKYIAVVEFQKRGAVHYHLLSNIRYMRKSDLASIWTHGFVKINRINNIHNVGAYISKYLQKDFSDPRLFGRRCYFTSQVINRPEIYNSANNKNKIDLENKWRELNTENIILQYEKVYNSEWQGQTIYRLFKKN